MIKPEVLRVPRRIENPQFSELLSEIIDPNSSNERLREIADSTSQPIEELPNSDLFALIIGKDTPDVVLEEVLRVTNERLANLLPMDE